MGVGGGNSMGLQTTPGPGSMAGRGKALPALGIYKQPSVSVLHRARLISSGLRRGIRWSEPHLISVGAGLSPGHVAHCCCSAGPVGPDPVHVTSVWILHIWDQDPGEGEVF